MLGHASTDMLIRLIRYVPSANKNIMDGTQGSGKHLASQDESAVTFFLNAIVSPAVLAERRQCDESGNLPTENSEIHSACTGVVVPLCIGMLSCV